jgi:two-component SAPR family response regulator
LYNLGLAYNNTGEAILSGLALEEALECARQSQLRRIEAYALLGIGYLYTDLDFYEPAMDAFRSSSEIAEEVNEKFLTFYLAMMRSSITGIQGDFSSAESYLAESRAAIEESTSKVEWGLWHRTSGRLALMKGELGGAVEQLEQACRLLADAARPLEMMVTRVFLAQAYYLHGQHGEALNELLAAFTTAEAMDNKVALIRNARFAGDIVQFAATQPRTSQTAKSLLDEIQRYEDTIPSIRRRLRAQVSEVHLEPPKFIIHTLGRTDVEVDGRPIEQRDWQYQKRVREVFFFLLSMPEGSTTEALAAGIWHDTLSSSVKIQVRNAIYRLRSALGHEVVQSTESGYSFNRNMDYENDAEQFEALLQKGQESKDPSQRAGYYRTACDLYCGPYLPDMEGTWVVAERERFWKLYVDAALHISRYFMETRNYNSAILYCEKILREDNAVEEAHRMILSVYGQRGERGLLKRQYEKCVLALGELGLKPSSETVSLYKSLINT